MDAAARHLARAWRRARRPWWTATAGAFAIVLLLSLGTVGVLAGMQEASQQRVAAFYTGAARFTPSGAGAAPAGTFANDAATLQQTLTDVEAAVAGSAHARVESTALLSRRSLLQAVVLGEDQFSALHAGAAADSNAYLVGILVGLDTGQDAVQDRLRPYVVAGRLPQAGDGNATELLLSLRQLHRSLSDEERARLADADPQAMLGMRFEVTAAHLDDAGRDVLRLPARVVGVYDSGLDALDDATVVVPIEDARRLVAQDPGGGYANVITVHGSGRGAAMFAQQRDWSVEGPAAFTGRYAGQLLEVLRWAGWLSTAALLVVPTGMLWLGLTHQLERSRREIAVCRALGTTLASIGRSLTRLVLHVLVAGLVPAALALAALAFLVAQNEDLAQAPAPLGFAMSPWMLLGVLALVGTASAVAVLGALQGVRRMDLASTLRAL